MGIVYESNHSINSGSFNTIKTVSYDGATYEYLNSISNSETLISGLTYNSNASYYKYYKNLSDIRINLYSSELTDVNASSIFLATVRLEPITYTQSYSTAITLTGQVANFNVLTSELIMASGTIDNITFYISFTPSKKFHLFTNTNVSVICASKYSITLIYNIYLQLIKIPTGITPCGYYI